MRSPPPPPSSPPSAGGLALYSSPLFVSNLHRTHTTISSWGLRPSCDLARALFFRATPDDPLRATRSRSQAAAYLTPSLLGHVVGLSVTGADDAAIDRTLRAHGVETNKLCGEWTGVSFVRWTRLVHKMREVSGGRRQARGGRWGGRVGG